MDAPKAEEPDAAWAEFLRSRQQYHDARGKLLVAHLPWLESIVTKAMRRLPARVNRDEIKSEAVLACLDLLDRYDPTRGAFIPFAKARVVGSIGDWVRRQRMTAREFSLDDLVADHDTSG